MMTTIRKLLALALLAALLCAQLGAAPGRLLEPAPGADMAPPAEGAGIPLEQGPAQEETDTPLVEAGPADMPLPDQPAAPPPTEAPAAETAYNVSYMDPVEGYEKTADTALAVDETVTSWTGGWYVVQKSVTISGRITVSGKVDLILADGCILKAEKGICVPTIWAQRSGTGTLNAKGADGQAPIGGDSPEAKCGKLTVNGGVITLDSEQQDLAVHDGEVVLNGGSVKGLAGCQPKDKDGREL